VKTIISDAIKPMLAVSGQPFTSPGWIFEPKIDGTRAMASVFDRVVLRNRRQADISYRYPEIVEALSSSATGCILDGEIAIFSNGLPNFAALARRDHQSEAIKIKYLSAALPASYIVFDVLYARGEPVMDKTLRQRREILREVLKENEIVIPTDQFPEKGEEYFQAALKMGIEGVMAKRLDSLYLPGTRSPDWIKIKKRLKLDLVVGGYIPGKGNREPYFGGLLLGAFSSNELIYTGRVGSGFSEEELQDIIHAFHPIPSPPFSNPPSTLGVIWLKPEIVVQVAAMEVTDDGRLRAPVFLRIRDDKDPLECTIDQMAAG